MRHFLRTFFPSGVKTSLSLTLRGRDGENHSLACAVNSSRPSGVGDGGGGDGSEGATAALLITPAEAEGVGGWQVARRSDRQACWEHS